MPFHPDSKLTWFAFSVLCLIFMAGVWRYSGKPFPIPGDYSATGKLVAWVIYGLAVAVPVATALLFVRDWNRSR